MNLTPPPNHHPQSTPPPSHLVNQNRSTPPASMGSLPYKYYSTGGMNVPPPAISSIPQQNNGRTSRNTPTGPTQHMPTASSRVSPNVLNPNLMTYGCYRQQSAAASYITNPAAAGFINNPSQIPVNVMNMQSQYQDQAAIQRAAAAQQNSMYSYPPYLLNNTMRR